MSGIDQILADYAGLRDAQEEFYKDLHQHPELSHQEQQTARAPGHDLFAAPRAGALRTGAQRATCCRDLPETRTPRRACASAPS